MKKTILFFTVVVLLSMASVYAQGGTTGPLTWEINNGTLTISGEGEMPNYYSEAPPWYVYKDDIHTLAIKNGVTSISSFAFSFFSNLTSASIASTVLNIEVYAFTECKSLPSIIIPNGLINIVEGVFYKCTVLSYVFIPKSVTSIDVSAFSACQNLTSFEVDSENNSYTSEDGILFNKDITVLICYPAGKSGAYIITSSVKTIGNGAFAYCANLTSVTIPNSVTSIGAVAFYSCSGLTSITIPNSVTSIEIHTFFDCTSLTSVSIPNSVTNIGYTAFRNCKNLQLITNLNTVPVNIDASIFEGVNQSTCTLEVPSGSITVYEEANIWKEFNIVGGGFLVNPVPHNSEHGYTTGDGLYELNATATVTATARAGYKFVNWTKDGEEISTDNPFKFTVTEDVELVAHFIDYVGVDELRITNYELRVYPNPTTGELHVTSDALHVTKLEVFDIYGRKQSHVSRVTSNEINIAHLPAGVYFVKVYTEQGVVVEKVIKN